MLAVSLLPLCLGWAQAPAGAGEQPVVLYKGLGVWHHNIHTNNPEAQKFFDQGLSLMYGFNRYESLRSFRKVAELDPQAAMAYWGMSMAQGPYINMDGEPEYKIKESCEAVNIGRCSRFPTFSKRFWRARDRGGCRSHLAGRLCLAAE